jgi:hypothetical protein
MIEEIFNYFDKNIITLLFFLIICIFIFKDTNIQIIVILSSVFYILGNYKDVKKNLIQIENSHSNVKHIIEDNVKHKTELHINDNINDILNELKEYKKYNKNAYRAGHKYIKLFLYSFHELEHNDIKHGNIIFDNAFLYLREAVNNFQSISISVPQENYYHSLKANNFKENKLGNNIGKLCKDLYQEGYLMLTNISLKLNELWNKNPDIYSKEIIFDTDGTLPSLTFNNIELY